MQTRKEAKEEEEMLMREDQFLKETMNPQPSLGKKPTPVVSKLPNAREAKGMGCQGVEQKSVQTGLEQVLEEGMEDELSLVAEKSASEKRAEELVDNKIALPKSVIEDEMLDLPTVEESFEDDLFCEATESDPSLAPRRTLADANLKGFHWKGRRLFRKIVDQVFQFAERLCIPTQHRPMLIQMAHDHTGYQNHWKVLVILRRRFDWPLMARDIMDHCGSCEAYQRCNKEGNRMAPMVSHPVITEPFECAAIDVVGPFPKGKGRMRWLLASVCMTSR